MKVLIDTNVLISAILNPSGTANKAFIKAVTYPNKGFICTQNIEELRLVFSRKFPDRPILRAAIHSRLDVLLTGDKDFLESNLIYPAIISPTEFLQI